jgi:dephospho-CoA kinase
LLKIGLTGGIGCGKSTIGKLFEKLGVPVIDADDIAHQLVESGQPALQAIVKVFGANILTIGGSLDRKQVREIVFSDPDKKNQLEAILHPEVFRTIQNCVDTLETPYCIISIPLLFETGRTGFVDRNLVVDCPLEDQVERVKLRNGLDQSSIMKIIDSQVSREFRLQHADDLIDNSGDGDGLAQQVKKLHNFYLSISTTGKTS